MKIIHLPAGAGICCCGPPPEPEPEVTCCPDIPVTMFAVVTGTGYGTCMTLGEVLVIELTYSTSGGGGFNAIGGTWHGSGMTVGGSTLTLKWYCQQPADPEIADEDDMKLDVAWDDNCEGDGQSIPPTSSDCDGLLWTNYSPASSPGIAVDVMEHAPP